MIVSSERTIKLLDHGHITLADKMGSDLTVVNAARASFGKWRPELDEKDIKLLKYLADNKHWSPFRHIYFTFRIKAPEFVMRQMYRHVVGCNFSSSDSVTNDHGWSEISLRYVKAAELDFYSPEVFRKQSKDNKQGSSGSVEDQGAVRHIYEFAIQHAKDQYDQLIDAGVAKEIARGVIPMSIYVECVWTASLQAVVNFIQLRDHSHAQQEIQVYAKAMQSMIESYIPHSMAAFGLGRKDESEN